MRTAAHRPRAHRRFQAALFGALLVFIARPLLAQNYYSVDGFEAPYYSAGSTLINQEGWALSGGTNSQWTVTNSVGVNGTAGVVASGTPDSGTAGTAGTSAYIGFNYPPGGAKPTGGMLVVSSVSIKASAPSSMDSLVYANAVYSNAGAEIGRIGLDYSAGEINAVVLTRINSTTGLPDPNGPVQATTVATNLLANTYYSFGLSFNFSKDTYNVSMNGTTIASSLPFSDTNPTADTSLQAEYLQIISGGNATENDTTGVFDNLSVDFETPVPEPSTWALLGLASAGLCGLAVRRRARQAALPHEGGAKGAPSAPLE
jgi:hypothetical protein